VKARTIAAVLIVILSTLFAKGVDEVVVAVVGDEIMAERVEEELQGYVSGFLKDEDKGVFMKMMKECEIGLSECPAFSKFPAIDFVIEVGSGVRVYDVERGIVEPIPHHIASSPRAIADYFLNFVMYFHLPVFRDPTAHGGDVYILMDADFKVLNKKCTIKDRTEIVDLRRCAPKNAVYARKLWRFVKIGNYVMALRKSDAKILWVDTKNFEVYRDGQIVHVPVLLSEGGKLVVYDIYNERAHFLSKDYVEEGSYSFSFEAYYDPKVETEQLVFLLFGYHTRTSIPDVAGEEDFERLVKEAMGVGAYNFVVVEGEKR